MKKTLTTISIATFMAISLFAKTSIWSGGSDVWTKGAGTEASPYLIESADQLAFIAEMVNAGVTDYNGKYFRLMTDMDLNFLQWSPIGESENTPFKGNIDGDKHFIMNIRITERNYSGLLGYIESNVIKNVTIKGDTIAGYRAGGIAGLAKNCTINNCCNFAVIHSKYATGGIIGETSESRITNCVNYGNITTGDYNVSWSNISNGINVCTDKDCASYYNFPLKIGDIYTDHNMYAGGIVGGDFQSNSTIEYCSNHGNISVILCKPSQLQYNKVNAQGEIYVNNNYPIISYNISTMKYNLGGIIGSGGYTISKCINYGEISDIGYWNSFFRTLPLSGTYATKTGTNLYNLKRKSSDKNITESDYYIYELTQSQDDYHIGGIAGSCIPTAKIYLCANIGKFKCKAGILRFPGGIVGMCGDGEGCNIEYCYNTGESGNKYGVSTIGIGGNAVKNSYCADLNSYGITTESGIVTNSYYIHAGAGGGTQKTEAQMKSVSFPIILNTDSTVFIMDTSPYVNNGFPIFKDIKYTATYNAEDISYTTAKISGAYKGFTPDSIGFEIIDRIIRLDGIDNATLQLSELSENTNYEYRFWAAIDGMLHYGDYKNFKTLQTPPCPDPIARIDNINICEGETYEFAGEEISQAGVYHDYYKSKAGCDSIIELRLNVLDTYKYVKYDTIRAGEAYDFYGQILTKSGVYNEYIPTTNRCNWIQLNLHVKENYLITFKNDDGSILSNEEWEEGTLPYCATPEKEEDDYFAYVFKEWQPEIIKVSETATYIANYTAIPKAITSIDDEKQEEQRHKPIKIVKNGTIYILLPDGSCYNTLGVKIE